MTQPEEIRRRVARTLRARALFLGAKRARKRATVGGAAGGGGPATDSLGWEDLRARALGCTACRLCETRTKVVFGEGDPRAELMFVGEAPGHDEDLQGRPFVGRAGQKLTEMIEAMGYARAEVYIANVLKCRPPENRDPAADEAEKCRPYLLRQIALVSPKVICALGRHALKALTGYEGPISRVRGRPMEFEGRIVVPTWHPAYLLRNPPSKREAWEDLKAILRILGRPVPGSKKQSG